MPEHKAILERLDKAGGLSSYRLDPSWVEGRYNKEMINHISDSMRALTSDLECFEPYYIPEHHRMVYRTLATMEVRIGKK